MEGTMKGTVGTQNACPGQAAAITRHSNDVHLTAQDAAIELLSIASESPFTAGTRPGLSRCEGFRFGAHEWVPVEAQQACEVAFIALSYGMFRHSVRIVRWRPDKPADECGVERCPIGRCAAATFKLRSE